MHRNCVDTMHFGPHSMYSRKKCIGSPELYLAQLTDCVGCTALLQTSMPRIFPFSYRRGGRNGATGGLHMAEIQQTEAQFNALSDAFRTRLRKVSSAQSHDRVQRIMLALGYAMALTPTGNPGFSRPAMYKGMAVNVWVADATLTAWPRSLLSPVWACYYTTDEPVEMIQYVEYDRLMDYLHEVHPEAFQTPSELVAGKG